MKWTNIAKGFLAILLSGQASISSAALLLEFKQQTESGNLTEGSTDTSFSAQGQGLKIGYMGNYVLAGIALERNRTEFKDQFAGLSSSLYNGGGIGTFLGFHFFDRFRLETTYLNSTLEPNNNSDFRYFGQYFSYGIGIRVWKGLMLNLAQFNNQYTQSEDDTTGLTNGLSRNIKTEGQIYSLSYIFVIN